MHTQPLHQRPDRALAVAQTIPVRGEVDANIDQHLRLVRLAAGAGAELVVFPELSLTGYEIELATDLAFSEADPRLAPLLDAAASNRTTVVVGAPVRLGTRLHVGAFILSPDRKVDIYTKHRLGAFPAAASCDGTVPPAEATVFHPGDRNPLLQFGDRVAALAICADIGRPSHVQEAVARGAAIYLASMFVIPSDFEGDSAKLRGYAVSHSIAVALANYAGPSGGLAAAGRSGIWAGTGEVVARLGPTGAGVAIGFDGPSGWRGDTIALAGR